MAHVYSYAIVVLTIILLVRWQKRRSRPPYPPGPKGLPLIGNIRDITPGREWVTYAKWSRQYNSDLIYLNMAGTHMIVVNSAKAAYDLFDRRSAIYSDRPRMTMITELLNWDIFALYQYGDKWRTARRIFHQYFNFSATEGYHPQEIKATHELLYRLAHKPEDYRDHIRLMAGSLILNIAYGIDAQSVDDPYLSLIDESMRTREGAVTPGSFLVDMLPWLKHVPEWFPGAGFKKKAREEGGVAKVALEVPFQYVIDAMANGEYTPSMTSNAVERFTGDKEAEAVLRGTCSMAYIAGGDTTVSVIYTFILAMVLYPDVLRKAQEELDTVVGQDKLPDFGDQSSLPYISAILKEVLRWIPATPLGVVHRLMVDDIYEGKFLPAGSLVLGNSWAILQDENVYKDPQTFIPERFLKDGQLDPEVRSPESAAFGFGRRICPGRHLAISSVFLNIACILSTFDIGKAFDENGKPITPTLDFSVTGVLCRPLPFKCSLKPRSQQAYDLINEAYAVHHPQS